LTVQLLQGSSPFFYFAGSKKKNLYYNTINLINMETKMFYTFKTKVKTRGLAYKFFMSQGGRFVGFRK